ncbi:hypothetical protein [Anaplasma platys]|uniref:hypothetical protein n=1 Tax=Anaplasma platys TaxID=949 RepID=UPI00145FB69D|nr:hypothetical protein [Anaplasma platys]
MKAFAITASDTSCHILTLGNNTYLKTGIILWVIVVSLLSGARLCLGLSDDFLARCRKIMASVSEMIDFSERETDGSPLCSADNEVA